MEPKPTGGMPIQPESEQNFEAPSVNSSEIPLAENLPVLPERISSEKLSSLLASWGYIDARIRRLNEYSEDELEDKLEEETQEKIIEKLKSEIGDRISELKPKLIEYVAKEYELPEMVIQDIINLTEYTSSESDKKWGREIHGFHGSILDISVHCTMTSLPYYGSSYHAEIGKRVLTDSRDTIVGGFNSATQPSASSIHSKISSVRNEYNELEQQILKS